jgi:hypothetical protein
MYGYNHYLQQWRWRPPNLMGEIPQRLPAVAQGAAFQFGGNFQLLGTCPHDIEDFGQWVRSDGISNNAVSYKVAGSFVNPYWAIEGNTRDAWNSGTDLGNAIYNSITSRGCDADVASIQFRVQPAPGAATPEQFVGTPYPTPGSETARQAGLFDEIGRVLGLPKDDAQLLVFGGAALLLVIAMKR